MMKTFTRKQLVHKAIEFIRAYLSLYGDTKEMKYRNRAIEMASVLEHLGIISLNKEFLLYDIINNECKRITKKESPVPNGRQDNHKTNLIITQAV